MADRLAPSPRRFEFVPTPAVLASRQRGPFSPCPVCGSDSERYLFHKLGVRFVRCRSCALVFANPPASDGRHYFDVHAVGQHSRTRDRELFVDDLASLVQTAADQFEAMRGRPSDEIVLAGRTIEDGSSAFTDQGVRMVTLDDVEAERLAAHADIAPILRHVSPRTSVLVLNELLEGCPRSADVMRGLVEVLPDDALVVVAFNNVRSFPAKIMRRYWSRFFAWKSVYFDTDNLDRLMDAVGLRSVSHTKRSTPHTLAYASERVTSSGRLTRALDRSPLGGVAVRLPVGTWVATYEKAHALAPDALTIVVPVFNEAAYIGDVLEALLAKELPIAKEVVVVESNSTDGSRDIVRAFEARPGLRVVYEDAPRGKGAAVLGGLAASTGSICIIQDADFEYDLDDYDALLEPILRRRTSFVLGSRSLGLDDWKVRQYASSKTKAFLMNFAQLLFAKTFNLLYQQRTTDINTMFKVFRRECIRGVEFRGRGFNFDIELVCRIVSRGFSPMEVPVNYVARGFDEGKKINFLTEFYPSYAMLFRCRFRR
jgi:Glycosyl transferase family 2